MDPLPMKEMKKHKQLPWLEPLHRYLGIALSAKLRFRPGPTTVEPAAIAWIPGPRREWKNPLGHFQPVLREHRKHRQLRR